MPYDATQAWQETFQNLNEQGERSKEVKNTIQVSPEVDTAINPTNQKLEETVSTVDPSPPASKVQASILQHEVKEEQTPAPHEAEVAQEKNPIDTLLDQEAREGEHVLVEFGVFFLNVFIEIFSNSV